MEQESEMKSVLPVTLSSMAFHRPPAPEVDAKISLRNLKRVAKELGETMTDAELLEMIERADNDQDGEINFEEFYAIMTKKTFN